MSTTSLVVKLSITNLDINNAHVYPRPLPIIDLRDRVDENGLNQLDKATLRQAWRLIMPFHVRIGRDVFYSYLTDQDALINKFRGRDAKLSLDKLHYHAINVMRLLDQIIFHYLDTPRELLAKLDEHMPKHLLRGVTAVDMLEVIDYLKDRLLNSVQLANHSTLRLEIALEKLLGVVTGFNIQKEERQRTTTAKYSVKQRVTE